MKKLKLLLFALMVATCTFKAYSQLVAEYIFDGNVATPSFVNYTVLANASPVLGGAGQTVGFNNGQFAFPDRARWIQYWTTNPVPNLNQHFRFTLTPSPSASVTITRVRFKEMRSAAGPRTIQMRSSQDNFTSVIWQQNIPDNTGWRNWDIPTILTLPPNLEIRLYAFNNEGVNGDGAWRIDSLRIYAEITNLPIELLSFTGEKAHDDVLLRWSTASEEGNDFFTIFRSLDMGAWQEIRVVPGAGTSQSRIDYQLIDEFPHLGTNYYKLRQTDFDGTFADSHVIAVDFDVGDRFIAFPNPAICREPIQTSKRVDFVIDQLGRLTAFENNVIEKTGVYTLVHIDGNGIQTTCRIVVTTK